jgi:hypothetical protein
MASRALTIWRTESSDKLDELTAAHASVGGTGRGRRYATEQINASLVVQLSAHFQLFCRDLHTETARLLVVGVPASYRGMLRYGFTERRALDRGNASTLYPLRMAREKAEFAPGTKVGVPFGGRIVPGFILEDRGVFGGQRIVHVRLRDRDDPDAMDFELPADELQPLPAAA